jgi:dolichol-phosphate mannosyltransferase
MTMSIRQFDEVAYRPNEMRFAPCERQTLFDALRLSIIVPTYCEAENVEPMIIALDAALIGIAWEVIFVDDDSPDETARLVRLRGRNDRRIRVIRRIGRRGLAGAAIEGMLASAADTIAVIDGDLQHDEKLLPRMLANIDSGADLVIASRYADSGDANYGLSTVRRVASRLATRLTEVVLGTKVTDPMSGFFMVRREVVERVAGKLSTDGFKLLFDILASCPATLKITELPYTFRPRRLGRSKLDGLVVAEFIGLVLTKFTRNWVSPRFFLFGFVGASGLAVHLAALRIILGLTTLAFVAAQTLAACIAMASNFFLNNALTFRDRRLMNIDALKGLLSFCLVCSVGTLANVGVAELIYVHDASWWHAGIAGAVMASVFNYAVSSKLTWRK